MCMLKPNLWFYRVGGKVRQMEWDSSGHRVAVMFDDSDLIALFRVLPKSHVELLTPLGFVRGHQDESPSAIAFQKDFTEGALLTIVSWRYSLIKVDWYHTIEHRNTYLLTSTHMSVRQCLKLDFAVLGLELWPNSTLPNDFCFTNYNQKYIAPRSLSSTTTSSPWPAFPFSSSRICFPKSISIWGRTFSSQKSWKICLGGRADIFY